MAEGARGQAAEILAYVKGDQGELMQRKERTRAVDVAARAGAVGGVARALGVVRSFVVVQSCACACAGCEQPKPQKVAFAYRGKLERCGAAWCSVAWLGVLCVCEKPG